MAPIVAAIAPPVKGVEFLRNDTEGRAYYRRKKEQGKTSMEAMRCLRRRLSDVVYRQLVADAALRTEHSVGAGPGGHSGTTSQSSVTGLTPDTGPSDKPLPGPAPTTLPSLQPTRKSPAGVAPGSPRRRAAGVNVERPTGRTTLTPTSVGAHSNASPDTPLDNPRHRREP